MEEVVRISKDDFLSIEDVPDPQLFHHNRKLLLKEHQFPCAAPTCKSTDDLGVIHIASWCGGKWYDFDKLKEFLFLIDPYGFSRTYRDKAIESVHDIRNLIVLCRRCFKERPFALTKVPFPQFVMQAVAKDGVTFEPYE